MKVVIVGAGLSGLTAASALAESGVDVTILEAAEKPGGRIQSIRDAPSQMPIADLGPTWVWPKYQPAVARWLDTLRLSTFPQFNDGNAVIHGYGPQPLRRPLPGQDGMVRIVGGPASLIDALLTKLGPETVRTSAPVSTLSADGETSVRVTLESGEVVVADGAIVAVPLRIAATKLRLPWASDALLAAMRAAPTWMSTHAKAVMTYETPFWRRSGLSGRIASRIGPLVEVHDHSMLGHSSGALFGFVGWEPARRQQDPNALKAAILSQLTECLGTEAGSPSRFALQDWSLHPFIVSSLDLTSPPAHPEIGPADLREQHLGGRVQFAVSEASAISPGLIEGALVGGERAALAMARYLER